MAPINLCPSYGQIAPSLRRYPPLTSVTLPGSTPYLAAAVPRWYSNNGGGKDGQETTKKAKERHIHGHQPHQYSVHMPHLQWNLWIQERTIQKDLFSYMFSIQLYSGASEQSHPQSSFSQMAHSRAPVPTSTHGSGGRQRGTLIGGQSCQTSSDTTKVM